MVVDPATAPAPAALLAHVVGTLHAAAALVRSLLAAHPDADVTVLLYVDLVSNLVPVNLFVPVNIFVPS